MTMWARGALSGLVGVLLIAATSTGPSLATTDLPWRVVQPGVAYTVIDPPGPRLLPIDGRIHVVRIDPARAALQAVMAGATDGRLRTAGQWCRERHLVVAINMGMYREDHRTNSGYARSAGYLNNPQWTDKFKSALAFSPKSKDAAAAVMADLDDPHERERLDGYDTVVQNLRLIRSGHSVWSAQVRRWSEAAVAVDGDGRVLFIFTRYPHAMKELNDILLSLPLRVVAAMHVEGGPEASLSVHGGGVDVDLNGSYESGFVENDGEKGQWPIPNVLAIRSAK